MTFAAPSPRQEEPWSPMARAVVPAQPQQEPGAREPLQQRVGNAGVVTRADALRGPRMENAADAQATFGNAAVVRSLAPARPPATAPAPEASPAAAPVSTAAAPPAPGTAAAEGRASAAPPAAGEQGGATPAAPEAGTEAGGSGPSAALDALAATPPSGMVRGLRAARVASAQGFDALHEDLARTPPTVERPSGLPRQDEAPQPAAGPAGGVQAAPPAEAPAGAPPAPPLPEAAPTLQAPLPASTLDASRLDAIPDEAPEDIGAATLRMLDAVPDTDESVDTSAGPRPTVALTRDADPARMQADEDRQRATADTAWSGAQGDMAQDEGENAIFPTVPQETLVGRVQARRAPAAGRALSDPLAQPEVAAAVDAAAGTDWATQVGKAREDDAAALQQKEQDECARRDETAAAIAQEEQAAADAQRGKQAEAREAVASARAGWDAELKAGDAAYTAKAKSLREDHASRIARTQEDAEAEARRTLDKAEADAEAERKKKVAEAEEKKREKKKEASGVIGWLKSKAKALVNAIREAVNAIFDALRRAVKFIIDQAKKLAVWAIEQARKAIVGLIHAFGAALMLAADVFLALFPKARDRAKALIRRGVQAAEAGVNAVADALKKTVCQLLDALGAALDFILELYQRAYNAILDVVEFFVVGLLEIIEGIGRLAAAAGLVGDHFLGQVQEEGIGVDLTQPLAIEKPDAETDTATAAQTAVASGALSPTDAALYARSSLNNSDVAVDTVARLQLEPELLATVLPQVAGGGEFHFGQNEEPQNQRGAILRDALAAQTGLAPAAPEAGAPEAAAPAAAQPDVAAMTPDQQLDYLEAQEMPHTCDQPKTEEPAKEEALPREMRIYGAFTAGQRFRYMWGQIKKGISQWWSCNWGKVVAVFAVGALVALLLGILTGGAIFAAIPPLMEIIASLMVGVAVARAASWVGDYLKLAWNGDSGGGAKALARAFAILIIELVFALLFNAGAVIKAAKSGLKGTIKAATGAVKNAIKTTAKAVGELGHATATAFRAGVKNARLIVSGFRNGFGEGVRTIGQLTRDLLSKVRFRGFYFRLRGLWLELWGRFNADVKVGELEITRADAELYVKGAAGSFQKVTPQLRTEIEAAARGVGGAIEEGLPLGRKLEDRVRRIFESLKPQHLGENPVLGEAWRRALQELEGGKFSRYLQRGELIKPASADLMLEMYGAARRNMNGAIVEVVDDLEKSFGNLGARIAGLPENMQMHHLLYKAVKPEFAVARENLILALRKTAGSPDELHDLLHLLTSGGQGNRWKTLQGEVANVIRDVYKF